MYDIICLHEPLNIPMKLGFAKVSEYYIISKNVIRSTILTYRIPVEVRNKKLLGSVFEVESDKQKQNFIQKMGEGGAFEIQTIEIDVISDHIQKHIVLDLNKIIFVMELAISNENHNRRNIIYGFQI